MGKTNQTMAETSMLLRGESIPGCPDHEELPSWGLVIQLLYNINALFHESKYIYYENVAVNNLKPQYNET